MFQKGEPDEAFDGPDSGYDIVVDDEDVGSNQYGHDTPQIHQVQHIANVETLQQFSPAYPLQPLQPIYRPVVYNHGAQTYFKENDAGALRTASNTTETDNKQNKNSTNTLGNAKTDGKVKKLNSNNPLATSEKTAQVPKIEKVEQIASTEVAKSAATEASSTKLPTPMDKALAVNTATATVSVN